MDFTIDSEQKALRNAARELAARNAVDRGKGDVPVGPASHDEKTWAALAEIGALGLPFDEAAGGFGATAVEVSIVSTELGRAGLQTAYAEAMVAGSILASAGGREELLGSLAEGAQLIVPALAEPQRAWCLTGTSVQASGSGDSFTLTGAKEPVPYAAAATHVIVTATVDNGVGLFLVERPTISGRSRVDLNDTPATLLVGPGQSAEVLARAINLGTVTVLSEALGAMEAALDTTVEYLKTRKQFGVPLMTFQTLTQRAADMYVSLELARSATLFAAMTVADDPDDALTISRAKVVCGQAGRHIGQEAIQLHGGIGMTAEYSVGHFTSRLTAIERTFGDTRQHLANLAGHVTEYESVDVLA